MKLVIVESPTKAKTIEKFLGKGFIVKSSFGHVRDLPKSQMGVDTEHNFAPHYVVPTKARKKVTDLRKTAEKADMIIFATDQDREGEAISWHLLEIFKKELKDKFEGKEWERIAFHEITEEAIKEALQNPRKLDLHLVDAQQARRVLDRLVGYELSPLLWAKVARGLSAGRVQSVALRFIVEREREIAAFKPEEYWTVEGIFNKKDDPSKHFEAKLSKIDGKALDKMEIKEEITKNILKVLKNTSYHITDISKKKQERQPGAPYTTSTLQQDANHKLHYSAKQTMMIAQQLYEGVKLGEVGQTGLISYMRTDSVNLSEKFINEARDFIVSKFGKEAVPEEARRYKTKSRLAQEAHEAIRPTSATRTPEDVKAFLDPKQFRLYELIWKRAIASQMSAAEFENTGFDVLGAEKYTFRATGSRILKNGFLTLYPNDEYVKDLPLLEKGDEVVAQKIEPKQHFTEPPARYSDATLVKIMEENGIGRPSTYAPTINTLIVRKYLDRIEGRRLKPTEIGMIVNDLLVEHFPTIVDYKFTASIEESLDEVAEGKKEWVPIIKEFYGPFHELIEKKKAELVKSEFTETKTDEVCEKCGKPMIVKLGRFGKFLACTGFPDCKNTKPVTDDGKAAPEEKSDEKCPKCGADMIVKHGRFGAFLSCSKYPDCKTMKPILKSTGVRCPKCDKGDIVERRSKRGRTFFGCETYPACDFVLWKKPTGEKCAECSSLMIYGAQEKTYCSNKECKNAPKRGAKKKMTEDEEE